MQGSIIIFGRRVHGATVGVTVAVAGPSQAEGVLLEGEEERGQQKEKEGEARQLT